MMGLTTFMFLENVYFILLLLRQLGKILLCRTCYTAVELSGWIYLLLWLIAKDLNTAWRGVSAKRRTPGGEWSNVILALSLPHGNADRALSAVRFVVYWWAIDTAAIIATSFICSC